MNLVKILISMLVALLVVLSVVLFVGYSNLNALTEVAIEAVGPEVTGTPVSVESVELELPKGLGVVRGLTIANPDGFSDAPALSIERIEVELEVASLAEPVMVIRRMVVEGVRVQGQAREALETNLAGILGNMQNRSISDITVPTTASPDLRFHVRQVVVRGAVLELPEAADSPGRVELADSHLSEPGGSAAGGMSSPRLAYSILRPILEAANRRLEAELVRRAEPGGDPGAGAAAQ